MKMSVLLFLTASSDTVPSKSAEEEFGMTTSTTCTKSRLIDEENSHATLIQPAQHDVGPIIEYVYMYIIHWCVLVCNEN